VKLGIAIEKQFGELTHDMMYLDTIATDPDYQRRGWGGKLLESMNDIVRPRPAFAFW
jgi:ribosomal protein S18 acetylase RimI-like enzyme